MVTEEDTKPLDEDKLSLHWVPYERQVNGGQFERGPKAKYETQKAARPEPIAHTTTKS